MLKTNPFEVARFGALSLPGADSVRPGLGDLHVLSSFRRYGWLQPLQAAARPPEADVADGVRRYMRKWKWGSLFLGGLFCQSFHRFHSCHV